LLLAVCTSPTVSAGNSSAWEHAYITNYANGTVSVIDLPNNTVTATIPVGSGPFGVAINTLTEEVYVANWDSNDVSVIDTTTNTVVATIPVGKEPKGVAVTPDGTKTYVTNTGSNTVSVINTTTKSVVANISVGSYPLGVAVSPNGNKAYVTNYGGRTVSVIDTATNTVTKNVSVGTIPAGVIVNSAGTKAYVANHGTNNVSVIDTARDTVTDTIRVGSGPFGITANLDGSKIYVTNSVSNTVSVISAATNTVIATIPVGNIPSGIAVYSNKNKVYVANHGSNTVSAINTITNSITSTISVGPGSTAFGQFIAIPLVPSGANLSISKQAPISAVPGASMTYNLYYFNFGNKEAQNVTVKDRLPEGVEFESASDSGIYNSTTRTVTWNIGTVFAGNNGYRTLTVRPQTVVAGTVINNNAYISTSDLETKYDDNEVQARTEVINSILPPNVTVEPSVIWPPNIVVFNPNPITFSYHSCNNATAVDIRIHFDDGGSDIVGNMAGGPPDWTYTTTFHPHHGYATVTYTVHGCVDQIVTFKIYIDPSGYIYDEDTWERISNASVWLQVSDGIGGWQNVPTGESVPIAQPDVNPLVTDQYGMYKWDVLSGSYRIHVEAPGYEPADSIVVSIPPPVTDLNVGLVHLPVFPIADFSSNVTNGNAPLSVQFTDASSNATAWNWDFGDGNNSTEQNPMHIYSTAGNYNVNLTVGNNYSSRYGIDSKLSTISVFESVPVLPVADFSSSVTSGNAPLSVQFTDLSNNATAWNWDFGDGSSSTEQNPMHIYPTAGNYNVNLTVSNGNGTDSKLSAITVLKPVPPAEEDVSSNATNVDAPVNVQIENLSQNANKINWNIGSHPFSGNGSGNAVNVSSPVNVQIGNLSQNASEINWNIGSQLFSTNFSGNGKNISAPVNVQIGDASQNATTINWNI